MLNGRVGLVFVQGALPEVETFRIEFYARKTRRNHGLGADFSLEHLSALKRVIVKIQCWDATATEVESFDCAIEHAVLRSYARNRQNVRKLHG